MTKIRKIFISDQNFDAVFCECSYQIPAAFSIVELDFQVDLVPFEVGSFHFEAIGAPPEPEVPI